MDALARDKVAYEEWHEEMRNQLIAREMFNFTVDQNIHVSAKKVREIYDADRERFKMPVEVKLWMIIVNNEKDKEEGQ